MKDTEVPVLCYAPESQDQLVLRLQRFLATGSGFDARRCFVRPEELRSHPTLAAEIRANILKTFTALNTPLQ